MFFLIKPFRYFMPVPQIHGAYVIPYWQLKIIMNYLSIHKMNSKTEACFVVMTKKAKLIPYAFIFLVSRTRL